MGTIDYVTWSSTIIDMIPLIVGSVAISLFFIVFSIGLVSLKNAIRSINGNY